MMLSVLFLLVPILFVVKRRWVIRIIQVLLVTGGIEWIRALMPYVEIRKSAGYDWIRLAIVKASTGDSGLSFSGSAT